MTFTQTAPAFIGVDLGGTTIKAVAIDADGHVLARRVVSTFGVDESALASLHSVIERLVADIEAIGFFPQRLGACTPGTVDSMGGTVAFAANLGWQDLALAAELLMRHGVPARIDHDARAAAAAELRARGANAPADLLFVPLGTGISAALSIRGSAVAGSTGAAGELGHLIVNPAGEACPCGQIGCVEAYAGATSIMRRYRTRGGEAASVEELVGRLHHDEAAAIVWSDAVDALARGLHSATAMIDPELVVVGGGLSRAGDRLLDPLRMRLDELFTWRPVPAIELSLLGSSAGLVGATLLAADHLDEWQITSLIREIGRENTPVSELISDGAVPCS
jgi:glucokinase